MYSGTATQKAGTSWGPPEDFLALEDHFTHEQRNHGHYLRLTLKAEHEAGIRSERFGQHLERYIALPSWCE
jgi:hypothetical protein